jgi:hypothetical protein
MFRRKEEVYSIKEFMSSKNEDVLAFCDKKEFRSSTLWMNRNTGVLIPLAIAPFLKVKAVLAAEAVPVTAAVTTGAMYDKMLHAFDPLITLVQALAYPVAMVVVLGGALFIMIGNKEKGFSMMQGAGLGYVLVQMTPMVLNILVEAMRAL